MPYKHRRHFILTNFTLPRLRTPGTPAFLQAICLEPYIRNFVRPPFGHSSHMAAPPALSHTTHTSMNLSSPFSVRVCFARLSRAYNPSHCIWLTLLGVSVNPLPGVTPSFEISVMQFSKAIHGFRLRFCRLFPPFWTQNVSHHCRLSARRLTVSQQQVSRHSPPNRTYTSRCIRLSATILYIYL